MHPKPIEPLRTEGSDSLTPLHTEEILKITLREIEIHWPNAAHQVTIETSDNLFDHPSHHGQPDSQPIPPGGTLARATFDLQLPHDAHPHTISIQPPDKLTVESAADASRALPWLERCRFRLPRELVALFLIAAATALSPALDDDDDTDDETDTELYGQS